MTIAIGDPYFLVSIPSPTVRKIRWDKENPPKLGQGREANRKYWDKQKKAYAELAAQYRVEVDKMKAVGLHKERRFKDEVEAKRYADKIERTHGVKMNAFEACDMFI